MFFVCLVLAIIWVFVVNREDSQKNELLAKNFAADCRKTNVDEEHWLVKHYQIDENEPLEQAYEHARSEMLRRGFIPCIPMSVYTRPKSTCHIHQYESVETQLRKDSYLFWTRQNHVQLKTKPLPGCSTCPVICYPDSVYANWPKNIREWRKPRKEISFSLFADGDYATYPGLGACVVKGPVACDDGKVYLTLESLTTHKQIVVSQDDKLLTKV